MNRNYYQRCSNPTQNPMACNSQRVQPSIPMAYANPNPTYYVNANPNGNRHVTKRYPSNNNQIRMAPAQSVRQGVQQPQQQYQPPTLNKVKEEKISVKANENGGQLEDGNNDASLFKYWKKRFSLFSKFEEGIMLDRESFYSVCPEVLSKHIADGCAFSVGIDPFCGAGGNVIQLAMVCKSVIAMDIDPLKIKMARHNAKLYGVEHKIKFIVGDFFAKGHTLKADVLVTSPPWGGPTYSRQKVFPLSELCGGNGGARNIMRIARLIAPRVVLHLPKNCSKEECVQLGQDFEKMKFEQCYLDGRLNCLTVYYSSFKKWNSPGETQMSNYCRETRNRVPQVVEKEVRLCSKREAPNGRDGMWAFKEYLDRSKSFLTEVGKKIDEPHLRRRNQQQRFEGNARQQSKNYYR